MKERSKQELENYADTARLTVAQFSDRQKRSEMNQHAKRALELMRKDAPTADDDALIDFLVTMSIMMASLMNAPIADSLATMERVFNNATLAAASLAGVYDLEDNTPSPTYKTVFEEIKAKVSAREAKAAVEESGLKTDSTLPAEEWEAMLSRQYL